MLVCERRRSGHQDVVDDVHDAVRLLDIGCRDFGHAALGVRQDDVMALEADRQRLAFDGLEGRLAIAVLDVLDQVIGIEMPGDDMVGEDRGQLRLVLGLDEGVDGAGWKQLKGSVGGCKDGDRTGAVRL